MKIDNFLPEQYRADADLQIKHNYLAEQFSDYDEIWMKIREVVKRGDFTLGGDVDLLEQEFAAKFSVKNAVAVGSGTDALFLSLKALGIDKGDEVITTPFTFFATIGAIVTAGARPIFCDVDFDFNINAKDIESKITNKTKAIMPVHWSGNPCDMREIELVSKKYSIPVVADACHAINAEYFGRTSAEVGDIACFSFHPLKNLNVWGDGGIVATNSNDLANKIRLIRNHGLVNRDVCEIFSYNSRLDTLQAVVARHLMNKIDHITDRRIENARYFDLHLKDLSEIQIPKRSTEIKHVYHLYSILCNSRDELQGYLISKGIDAKVHYPIPMHLQPAAAGFGYQVGDFPVAENICSTTLSLPVHEFVTKEDQDYIVKSIKAFYKK